MAVLDRPGALIKQFSADALGALRGFAKSRSASGGFTAVQADDILGEIPFFGADGDEFIKAAAIRAIAEGTISNGIVPARLALFLADAAGVLRERLRVANNGAMTVRSAGGDVSSPFMVRGAGGPAINLTGTTAETVMATVKIPGGSLGPNGGIRVSYGGSYPNSANTKTYRVRLGGLAGTLFQSVAGTTTQYLHFNARIHNRNDQAVQVGGPPGLGGGGWGSIAAAVTTSTIDTTVDQDLVITGQLQLGTETMVLEHFLVETFYRD